MKQDINDLKAQMATLRELKFKLERTGAVDSKTLLKIDGMISQLDTLIKDNSGKNTSVKNLSILLGIMRLATFIWNLYEQFKE